MKNSGVRKCLATAVVAAVVSVAPVMGWAVERDSVSDGPSFIEQFDADGDGLVSMGEFPGDETQFSSLDTDGSQYIDETEALQAGPPPHDRPDPETLLEDLDRDGDGLLSADEFPGPADHFDRLDTDGDGLVSLEELLADRPGPGPAGEDRFAADDADQDGLVSQSEFSGPADLFDALDADGDGYISESEARPAPPGGGPGPFADAGGDQ